MSSQLSFLSDSPAYQVKTYRDITYGKGIVGYSKDPYSRNLKMDVYKPIGLEEVLKPVIVLAFGGAFHKGSKENDAFTMGEGMNTSVAWYAKYWASLGFISCCIDYRLVQEDPDPGNTPVLFDPSTAGTERMQIVRASLGLKPLSAGLLANGIEAASDDMAAAVTYIMNNHKYFRIDPTRIGLWGWSAGARNALHAVFFEQAPAKCIVALSPYIHTKNLATIQLPLKSNPSVMLVKADRDLPHISKGFEPLAQHFQKLNINVQTNILDDTDHFYSSKSIIKRKNKEKISLLKEMTEFFVKNIGNIDQK